jgi:hypothetical protein
MPAKPRLATTAAGELEYQTWDDFVSEAIEGIKPFGLRLPGDEEPTVFPCPTGAQMQALGVAQRNMDDEAAAAAMFGEHADRIMELSAGKPFVVRARLMAKVMEHYGLQMGALGES